MSNSGATTNADEIERLLIELGNTFDLTLPGDDGAFGDDLADIFAEGVRDRVIDRQLLPSGRTMPPNQGEYGEAKDAAGKPVGVGLEGDSADRMLSLPQLKGERTITPDRVTVEYGVTGSARDKASYFTLGSSGPTGERSGAKNQPGREFWDFDDEIVAALSERCEDRLRKAIADINGGGP